MQQIIFLDIDISEIIKGYIFLRSCNKLINILYTACNLSTSKE